MPTTECTDYTNVQEAKIAELTAEVEKLRVDIKHAQEVKIAELTAEVEKLRVDIKHAFNDGFMYGIERDDDNDDDDNNDDDNNDGD